MKCSIDSDCWIIETVQSANTLPPRRRSSILSITRGMTKWWEPGVKVTAADALRIDECCYGRIYNFARSRLVVCSDERCMINRVTDLCGL